MASNAGLGGWLGWLALTTLIHSQGPLFLLLKPNHLPALRVQP
jgi:hypothetical protein